MSQYRDASKRLTFDFTEIPITEYLKISKNIAVDFKLKAVGELIHSFNETFQDYEHGNLLIGLEWDIWSGYIVVAKNTDSEVLAKQVADFINKEYIFQYDSA